MGCSLSKRQLLERAVELLEAIAAHTRPGPPVFVDLEMTLPDGKKKRGNQMVNLTDVQKYRIRVKDELDSKGFVVSPANPFTATVSDDTLGVFVMDPDGLGGEFTASKPGAGSVTLTDPVANIAGVSNFTISPGPAATVELDESAPVAA
jgi:hypothetical protein